MNKHLLFSLLSTCLLVSPLAARDHEDREEQDQNSNEYDLYERNQDDQDFDQYNFPQGKQNKPSLLVNRDQQVNNQNSARVVARNDHGGGRGGYRGGGEGYRGGRGDGYRGGRGADVEFYEEGGYDQDFDPYFPDEQYQYNYNVEQSNYPGPYDNNVRVDYQGDSNYNGNYNGNSKYQNNQNKGSDYKNNQPSSNKDKSPDLTADNGNVQYCPSCHKYH